jgi:hypothetical protein
MTNPIHMTHPSILRTSLAFATSLLAFAISDVCGAGSPLDIGSRRELFVDDYLVERMSGASLKLHHPIEREVTLRFDHPWEGHTAGIASVFQDGDKYRMFYRGKADGLGLMKAFMCYAESQDGIHWTRPSLGLHEFQGSKENNIVLTSFFPVFKDTNPKTPASERYKGFGNRLMPDGRYPLTAMASADGFHWRQMWDKPVITHGDFDSANIAFYDPLRQQYMAYYRVYRKGIRDILHATSADFLHWNDALKQPIVRSDGDEEHLYTNATIPYFRAPHIYVAMPMRYMPQRAAKRRNADNSWTVGNNDKQMWGVTDAVFMTSRDGVHFDRRFLEAFIRPGLDPGRWVTRNNLPAWGVIPTRRMDGNEQEELSVFWTEHYYTPGCRLRRGTLRLDGFVSVNAPFRGGELVTKPFTFSGKHLTINYSTSAAGSVQVEIQDASGQPLPGFALADMPPLYGDELDATVAWKSSADVSALAGKPVRLRFVLKDADVFAMRFAP